MRGGSSITAKRATAPALLLGALMLSGCGDPTANFRKPELPTCQRFLRSKMRVPTSFHRTWYNVSDFPVTRAQLAQATGNAAQAATAINPMIRRVSVQYTGNDGFGAEATGFGTCLFPMTETGKYAADIEDAVTRAVHDNEQRTLAVSTGQQGVVAASCCTAPGFDARILTLLHAYHRNAVAPGGRKL